MKNLVIAMVALTLGPILLPAQPTITQMPANQVLSAGGTIKLSVTASGSTQLAYQWLKDNRLITGATNRTMSVAEASVTNSGFFYVVVTDENGMAISRPASVAVDHPSLIAFGSNNHGQLGDGTRTEAHIPITVASNVVAGAAGIGHSLYVTADGVLWAMGNNTYGQLGTDQTTEAIAPIPVASNVVAVAAGTWHSLFVTADGTLWAMGYNSCGQLGNGTSSGYDAANPIPAKVATNVVMATAGYSHSLFVKTDGTLWAMGYNYYGQLGNGATIDSVTPIQVTSNVVAVVAGGCHSLFINSDRSLWAMGNDDCGQLGNRTVSSLPTPAPIKIESDVVAVAAGERHSLFLKSNLTLWVMGNNERGQLGDGTTYQSAWPICLESNVVAVAAKGYNSMFLKADGTLWAMGDNRGGQLGDGTTSEAHTPVSVPHLDVANFYPSGGHALIEGMNHNAIVTLTNFTQDYSGSGISVTATTIPPGLVVNLTYNGSPVPPTNVGNYTVVGTVFDAFFFGSTTNTLTINPNATVTLTNLVQTYTGLSIAVTAFTTPAGLPVKYTYNGSYEPPTNVGSYTVVGTIDHPTFAGSATNTLVIIPNATVTLGRLKQPYTGEAIRITTETTPPGLTVNLTYNGSSLAPTNPGNYTVIGTINEPNFVGGATNTLIIAAFTVSGPTNQVVELGGSVNLEVTANGIDPAYQWFKDGRWLLGQTNRSLTLTNASVIHSGSYYVVVTNGYGMTISLPASVTVENPSLLAWGHNSYGELGNGTSSITNRPTSVVSNAVTGAAGGGHSLFITADGRLWAMGMNNDGQLGNGKLINTNRPVNVASNAAAVAAGSNHSLFVDTNGILWGMGYNGYGQLGNGTSIGTSLPIRVASNVVAAAAGQVHSLCLMADGTLWTMGKNDYGQLGNGKTSNTNRPVSVASNVVAIAAGAFHSLFVKSDGTVWVMGKNDSGQLGNGKTMYTNRPTSVATNVLAVAAGASHSLFVKSDGTLWASGANNYGQLGSGKLVYTNRPISVASNVVAVSAGFNHSLYVRSDGSVWVMGKNDSGQLGIGTWISVNRPTNVSHLSAGNIFPSAADHTLALGVSYEATVMLSNLPQSFTGYAISVTARTVPPGLTVNLTYNGSPIAPTNVGTYTVVGTVIDPNYVGSATNTLIIKPNATVTLDNLTQAYTGGAINVTAITTPEGLPVNLTYNGSPFAPTNVGTYTVIGSINHPNYFGTTTNTLVITPNATITLEGLYQTYTGSAISVTASTVPPGLTVNLTYNGSPLPPTNAGRYTVVGTVGNVNYYGSTTNSLVIAAFTLTKPTHQAVPLGGTVALCVTAGGDTGHGYQWIKDGRLVLGATNSTLTLAKASVNKSGAYYVVVTNKNGMVISQSAFVTIGNPCLLGWGYNEWAQLGTGGLGNLFAPITITSNVVAGSAGGLHSMFITADERLWAMGDNRYGQLGNGTLDTAYFPISIASNVSAVAAGSIHSLFITTDGSLWAIGDNQFGQLGNGTTISTNRPVRVAEKVVVAAAGEWHSLYVTANGLLWGMGGNANGELGNGTLANTCTPILVASNVVAVAAGLAHSLFLTADRTLWAMGGNTFGQLGNGSTSGTNRPFSVASNVVAVAAGWQHSLFVDADGILWATGYNEIGQLGIGTRIDAHTPTSVTSNVVMATAGDFHSLFGTADGLLWAMGYNGLGALGSGNWEKFTNASSPILVPNVTAANVLPADHASHSLALGVIHSPGNVTLGLAHESCVNIDQFTIQFVGIPNYPYILQSATNLLPPIAWQSIWTNPADANGNWSFALTNGSGQPVRFYRTSGQ